MPKINNHPLARWPGFAASGRKNQRDSEDSPLNLQPDTKHRLGMARIIRSVVSLAFLIFFYGSEIGRCEALLTPAGEVEETVTVQTAWSTDKALPGGALVMALRLDIRSGYHINADAAQIRLGEGGFVPFPTAVKVARAPDGLVAESAYYPKAHAVQLDFAEQELMVFDGQITIYLPIRLDAAVTPSSAVVGLELVYQACGDNFCLLPETRELQVPLEIAPAGTPTRAVNPGLFAAYLPKTAPDDADRVRFDVFGWGFALDTSSWIGWGLLLLIAGIGGLLLNVTPCVLPMIPIKIISLSQASRHHPKSLGLGLAMFSGVLFFWLTLGLLIGLVSEVTAANQLFHYPLLTIGIGVVIAAMGLSVFGTGAFPLPGFVYRLSPEQSRWSGSFGVGILTAVLSTPCTAPFMGAAAAWAATRQPATTMLTFAAIGTGMGLPYLILSAFPSLVNRMPKSGPVSELVKQSMGIFILAAAAYFVGVGVSAWMAAPADLPHRFYWWPVSILCALAGLRLTVGALRIGTALRSRALLGLAGLIIAAASISGGFSLIDRGPIDWKPYSPGSLEQARSAGKTVVMVFTAEWCLNCKALEQSVFKDPRIIALLDSENILPIKVDITGHNPAGKAKLREIGHLTIPLLLVYSPGGCRVLKSDFYTVEQVAAAVEEALQNTERC
jgi:thiol:disulfide interchange protein DsbD